MNEYTGRTDAMSDVLELVRMRPDLICPCDLSESWSLGFEGPMSHFHIVQHGSLWLTLDKETRIRLHSGDLAVLPLGDGHSLASDLSLRPVPVIEAVAELDRGGVIQRVGTDVGDTRLVCGRFSFAGVLAPKLLSVLPRLIHIEGRHGHPLEWLRLTTQFLADEARNPRPATAIIIGRLVEILFIQAVREWGGKSKNSLGWLSGLKDSAIGRALTAIHNDPSRKWTVADLAERASLSRSAFAVRFAEISGQTPLRYIALWRLGLAADQLRSGTATIAEIADNVGYASESALTRAFKAQFGKTPSEFRQRSK